MSNAHISYYEETQLLLQQRWNYLGREVRAEDFTDQESISVVYRIIWIWFNLHLGRTPLAFADLLDW